MDTWRCPHCGTTQADGPRCWACSRYPVACGSCRNFRRAVAGRFGYCGLDPSRATLLGDEVRSCWESPIGAEAYEGLFRELTVIADRASAEPSSTAAPAREGTGGTRTWAVPVYASTATPSSVAAATGQTDALGSPLASSDQGLVDAPHVPAREIRSIAERLAADDR